MMRSITTRRVVTIVALTLAWCGLWQELSVANVISGLVVSSASLALGIGTPGVGRICVRPLLHLLGTVAVDLVVSTVHVAREIATPADSTEESIVGFDVPPEARHHLLLLIVAITVTPGTAVVDADRDTGTLYLHLLHHNRRDEVLAHVDKLARLVCEALPVPVQSTTARLSSTS